MVRHGNAPSWPAVTPGVPSRVWSHANLGIANLASRYGLRRTDRAMPPAGRALAPVRSNRAGLMPHLTQCPNPGSLPTHLEISYSTQAAPQLCAPGAFTPNTEYRIPASTDCGYLPVCHCHCRLACALVVWLPRQAMARFQVDSTSVSRPGRMCARARVWGGSSSTEKAHLHYCKEKHSSRAAGLPETAAMVQANLAGP